MSSNNGLVPVQPNSFPFARDRSNPAAAAGIGGFGEFSGDRGWLPAGNGGSSSGDENDDEEDEYEDGDEGGGFVSVEHGCAKSKNDSGGSSESCSKKGGDGAMDSHNSALVLNGVVFPTDGEGGGGNLGQQQYPQSCAEDFGNAVTVAEKAHYHAFPLQSEPGPSVYHQKEVREVNGCGFSGRRDSGLASSYWETLRSHLSDPITSVLMDDAFALSCGHSFGSDGMQHVYKMKACYKCSQPVIEVLVRPNLSLRAAVQAFRREEEMHLLRASKRRKEKSEQEKCIYDDPSLMDHSRSKGVQFPFVVSDRVLIKGNKRTPPRFVGRAAVITTQCLNGWYVVKTLDNAESVKLQYRSLEKLADNQGPNMVPNKVQMPNWL